MVPPSVTPEPRLALGDRLRLLALHLVCEDGPLVAATHAVGTVLSVVWALVRLMPRSTPLATRRTQLALHDALRARHARRHPVQAVSNQAVHARLSLSDHVALLITERVGTMACAILFAGIGVGSLIGVFTNNALLGALCGSISSYFLQLVLLPIISMGQNLQAQAAEVRAEADHDLAQASAATLDALKAQVWALSRDFATLAATLSVRAGNAPTAASAPLPPLNAAATPSPSDTQPAPRGKRAAPQPPTQPQAPQKGV